MPASVWRWNAATGHPRQSWSVVLEAGLDWSPSAATLSDRLYRGWTNGLGAFPAPQELAQEDEVGPTRQRFADTGYSGAPSLVRIARSPTTLLVAAHHSVLDGIGLLALLAILLDGPVHSGIRGIPTQAPRGERLLRSARSRLRQAVATPSAHLPTHQGSPGSGDHLLARRISRLEGGTATIVAAVSAAFADASPPAGSNRVVAAVAMSRREGHLPTLEDQSAYVRLAVLGQTAGEVRDAMAAAKPEPAPRDVPLVASALLWMAGPLAKRQAPTFLVSNLGRLEGPPGLRTASFWPAPPGRRSFAVGAATVGAESVLTLRTPRSAMDPRGAGRLLMRIAERIEEVGETGGPGSKPGGP
jgi:hypothetical protein